MFAELKNNHQTQLRGPWCPVVMDGPIGVRSCICPSVCLLGPEQLDLYNAGSVRMEGVF